MKLWPVGTSGPKIWCPRTLQVLSGTCWGSGFSLMQLAVIFSIRFSLCFLVCFCWLSYNGLFSFLCLPLALSMLFSTAFSYFCLSAFIPWSFFPHLIMLLHGSHITLHLYSCCFWKEVFFWFPIIIRCLFMLLCPILISVFAHSYSKQEQSYTGEKWVWRFSADLKSKQLWKISAQLLLDNLGSNSGKIGLLPTYVQLTLVKISYHKH